MQFFISLIILAPTIAKAMPAVSERGVATSDAVYTYLIPDDYRAAHPYAPESVSFNQAQFDEFKSLFPAETTAANEVIVTRDVSVSQVENHALENLSEQGIGKKLKCWACKAGCGILAGDAIEPCIAVCLATVC
ncbi:hypothetical protein E8E13_000628 [Curvularia kusanoi]|uniref:Uncharacterized protein n=1 Tax=Curvularia kusanoi TaxID=90978 RepID=A0A9P4T3A1_CURKU|nr:hypothetical protein E8E13_000628 [Curvularia kusanoi]